MPEKQEWVACAASAVGDVVRWNEPLWAAPSKPRGKPDKVGEQQVTAQVLAVGEVIELKVIKAEKLAGNAPLKVKAGDHIRRKQSTLEQGSCRKRV
jgi:hypothetical protein